jgi:hypothetical protein
MSDERFAKPSSAVNALGTNPRTLSMMGGALSCKRLGEAKPFDLDAVAYKVTNARRDWMDISRSAFVNGPAADCQPHPMR